MWMTIISFIGGPVIKGLIDGYKAKLAAGNTSEKIASETASAEIAAQVSEANAIMQYRIAEIGHWYEPDKLMGYFVAIYFGKLLIFDKVLGLGTTDPLAGFAAITSKRGLENEGSSSNDGRASRGGQGHRSRDTGRAAEDSSR